MGDTLEGGEKGMVWRLETWEIKEYRIGVRGGGNSMFSSSTWMDVICGPLRVALQHK